MTYTDSELFEDLKRILRDGYWTRFNTEAQEQMARAAWEAIRQKESKLIAVGAGSASRYGIGMPRRP